VAIVETVNTSCFTFAVSDIMVLTQTSESNTPLEDARPVGKIAFEAALRRDFNVRVAFSS
jgi:hypothetical protein